MKSTFELDLIAWPVLLKYSGDDEMVYIGSQEEWDCADEVQQGVFEPGDRVLDKHGRLFLLQSSGNHRIHLVDSGSVIELETVVEMV